MNLSPDDPKLTAYALGELPANEAKEVELELQKSPELRAAVEEIRQTAELLKSEFVAEPTAALSKTEKDAVIATIQPENVISLPNRNFWRTAGLSAIAASILCIVAWQLSLPKEEPVSVAQLEAEKAQAIMPNTAAEDRAVAGSPAPAASPVPAKQKADFAKVQAEPKPMNLPADKQLTSKSEAKVAVLEEAITEGIRGGGKKETVRQDLYAKTDVPVGAITATRSKDQTTGKAGGRTIAATSTSAAATPELQPSAPVQTEPASKAYAFNDTTGSSTTTFSTSAGSIVTGDSDRLAKAVPARTLRSEGAVYYNYDASSGEVAQVQRNFNRAVRRPEGGTTWFEGDEHLSRRNRDSYFRESELRRTSEDTARYPKYKENNFETVLENPLSTFSIDVDTASYANVRRFLSEGRMPPKDAVRIEEMINYFSYNYPQPKGDEPFSVNMEIASCPWQPEHRLLRVGLKGKEMARDKRPASNFVFLMDVSGSMSPQERLPLIKQALRMLVKQMTENDRIAIVVYASNSGVVLESTSAVNKEKILEALDRLEAGGSTNGGQGIQRAYALAEEHFIKGGVNRVILCTDGDFNVGITDQGELLKLIEKKAKTGVFLSVLGVGTDNYKDALMQKLADKGNGNYHYLDSVEEAHKVLIKQMNGTLVTIAKDVKIQIEFNPAQVSSYRLIGYEKRILAAEDFNNDKKDAGEIGAGHTVTALYEVVPVGSETTQARVAVDDLKYQRKIASAPKPTREPVAGSKEMLTLKLRYKKPDGDKSVLREHTLVDQEKKLSQASTDFRFAASVASFGMVLKDSEQKGRRANFGSVLELAKEAKGDDKEGYRAEFINLVKKARELQRD